MKILNSTVKTIAALCIMGAFVLPGVFFSCSLNDTDKNGTLVINLPGSDSARAVSSDFTKTLKYRIVCGNGTDEVRRDVSSGTAVSFLLSAGQWTVTLTVLNAAYQDIGSSTKTVVIEGGKTTTLPMSVPVDTGGNSITYFALRDGDSLFVGDIQEYDNENSITIYVNNNNRSTEYSVEVTHTGVSISPNSDKPLDFSQSKMFTVTSANEEPNDYTVTVLYGYQDASPYLDQLSLSGQVYGGQSNDNKPNLVYQNNAHVYLEGSKPGTEKNYEITKGILDFSIATPPAPLASLQNEWKKIDGIHAITLNTTDVPSASLNLRAYSEHKNYYILSRKRAYTYLSTTVNESICYLYVNKDVTVTAPGKKLAKNGIAITASALDLELKEGWNTVYTKEEINEDRKTGSIEIRLWNPVALKWTLDFVSR